MVLDPRTLSGRPAPETCRKCGYDLRGLPAGNVCPECGWSPKSRKRRAALRHDDQLAHAPGEWLRWFAAGAWALAAAVVMWGVAVPAVLVQPTGLMLLLIVLAGFGWAGGVFIVTRPRPKLGARAEETDPEWEPVRWGARGTAWAWPLGAVLAGAGVLPWEVGAALAAIGLAGAAFTAVYLARLADWAGDDALARSLRSWVVVSPVAVVIGLMFGWAIATAGTGAVANIVRLVLLASGLFLFPLIWVVWFAWNLIRAASLAQWAVRTKRLTEARQERLARGTAREARSCETCGYDLVGLPYPTRCPECGEAEVPERPPRFTDAPKVDDSPIPLEGE